MQQRPPSPPSGRRPRHAAEMYRRPASLRLIRGTLITVLTLAALAIVYTLIWYFGVSQLRDQVVAWFESRSAAGLDAGYDRIETAGFPAAFRVVILNPRISDPAPPSWSWQGSRTVVEMVPWRLGRLRFDLAGEHDLRWTDPAGGARRLVGPAGRLTAEGTLHEDGLPSLASVDIGALDLSAEPAGGGIAVDSAEFHAKRLFPEVVDHEEPTLRLSLDARGVTMPEDFRLPLGNHLARLDLDARLLGALAWDALPGNLAGSLAAWRDDGGSVEVGQMDARYGPLGIQASGTLALDEALQPIGSFTARFEGFFSAVEALQRAGLVDRRDAAMAKLVLGALAKRPAGGGPATLSVPLSIQERSLFVGPVKLWRVPLVDWGGGVAPDARFQILR